jgi:hypothetical protein
LAGEQRPVERVRSLLKEGKNAEAVRIYEDLDYEKQDRMSFSRDEAQAIWKGRFQVDREIAGTQEDFEALSEDQKQAVEAVQKASFMDKIEEAPDWDFQEHAKIAEEAIQSLDGGEVEAVREALPSRHSGVFEEIRSEVESGQSEENAPPEEKGQDEGQDSSSKYDLGYGHGRF